MENRAFEQVLQMHKDRVHSYAAHMLHDREEAKDVAQEALIRLWRHRGQVEQRGARLWLMRTVHNLCIDRIRRRKVRSEVRDGDEVLDRRPDRNPGPQRLAESGQLSDAIGRALGSMSASDRAVLVMREVQELPYDEIANTLGMPLGTLKARLHRARERLRGKLCRAGVRP